MGIGFHQIPWLSISKAHAFNSVLCRNQGTYPQNVLALWKTIDGILTNAPLLSTHTPVPLLLPKRNAPLGGAFRSSSATFKALSGKEVCTGRGSW